MNSRPTLVILSAFYTPWVSGAERCAVELVARLSPRYRFVVVTARLDRRQPPKEVIDGVEVIRVGLGGRFDKWLYPILALGAVRRIRPALIHAIMESYAGIALGMCALFFPRLPRILTLQSGEQDLPEKQKQVPPWLWRWIHAAPDRVTAISHALAERATRLRGSDTDVEVIPNGVAVSQMPVRASAEPGRMVCVARLSREKGVRDVIDALPEVMRRVPEAHVVLVGDGPLRGELEALAQARGVAERVRFCGALPHKQAMAEISQAAVFVCPSLAEGLGIVFIEAQAIGVPVVGTRVGGIPDVVIDGETGLLVPPHAPQALAEALVRQLTDQAGAARMAAAASARIPLFAWDRIAEQYAAAYQLLLAEKRLLIATGIYPPAIGGPATYVRTIALALATRGWRVEILTYGDASTELPPPSISLRVVARRLPVGLRHAMYGWQAWRALRRTDILFLQDSVSAGWPATCANMLVGRPVVLKVVGDHAWEQGQARFHVTDLLDDFQHRQYAPVVEVLRFIQQRVARRARRVITPSAYLAGIVALWGVAPDRVRVIPNAVDVKAIRPVTAPLSERPMRIVAAGRLVPWKGMRILLAALPLIRAEVPEARLTIIGDGPERQALEEGVRALGLSDVVEFTGRLSHAQVMERVAAARVFVLPSSYEGFSHQLVEAMAAGVPVVATRAGGNPEAARHEQEALLVPYGDSAALAQATIRLLRDWPFATRLAQAAQTAAQAYTVERMVDGLVTVLNDVYGR